MPPIVSSDPRHTTVLDIVGGLRPKLIDLTGRNRLISFSHTDRSRRELRVVQPDLERVWAYLMDGKPLRLCALPLLPEDRQKAPHCPAPKAWAIENGLPAEYEAATDEARPAKTPAPLQTLYFEEELAKRQAGLHSTARLSLTERGATSLFAVFGFLEWYEPGAKQPFTAPLLTVPLSVERQTLRGKHIYTFQWSGEEPQVNIALVEKLRKDGQVPLPVLADQGPEAWFAELEATLPGGPQPWRLHRWLTFAILDFMRLAMWHDLAPGRWGGKPVNPLLLDVLGGLRQDPPPAFAPAEVDTPVVHGLVPGTVMEADESQFRALAEAMRGRSLVIQGPPGTGKSQTITNLIALALHAKKRVLFISEKQAALEVVRNRLEQVGLGPSCLTLHSARADRKELIQDLAGRLAARTSDGTAAPAPPVAGLPGLRAFLNQVPASLNERSGIAPRPVQQMIGLWLRACQAAPALPAPLVQLQIPDPLTWTQARIEATRDLLGRVVAAWNAALPAGGTLASHPWHGLVDGTETAQQQAALLTLLDQILSGAQALQRARAALAACCPVPLSDADCRLGDPLAGVAALPAGVPLAWLRDARHWSTRQELEDMARRLQRLSGFLQKLDGWLAPLTPLPSAHNVMPLVPEITRLRVENLKMEDLLQEAAQRQHLAGQWAAAAPQATALWEGLKLPARPTVRLWAAAARLAQVVASLPEELWPLRSETLCREDAGGMLRQGQEQAADLREQRSRLEDNFPAFDLDEAKRCVPILKDSAWWSFLLPAWWEANAVFERQTQSKTPASASARGKSWLSAIRSAEAIRSFEQDETLNRRLGGRFPGLDTDWAPMIGVAAWADQVREAAGPLLKLKGAHDTLELLLWRDPDAPRAARTLPVGVAAGVAARGVPAGEGVADVAPRLLQEGAQLRDLRKSLIDLRLRPHQRLEHLPALTALLEDYKNELNGLSQAHGARLLHHPGAPALPTTPAPLIADLDAALRWTTSVGGIIDPSTALMGWLLSDPPGTPGTRLAQVSAQMQAVHSARRALDGVLGGTKAYPGAAGWLSGRDTDAICADLPPVLAARGRLGDLVALLGLRLEVVGAGVWPVLGAVEGKGGGGKIGEVLALYERVVWESIVTAAIAADASLAPLRSAFHERLRQDFVQKESAHMKSWTQALISALAARPVAAGHRVGPVAGYTDAALLLYLGPQTRPRVTIRHLFAQAGRAIQDLAPCLLMSPLSVAQYLKPDAIKFDLVVMDEASQLRPEDAIGALLRAGQAVIVGDPQQMPPSDFFRASASAEEADQIEQLIEKLNTKQQNTNLTSDEAESLIEATRLLAAELEDSILDVAARQLHPYVGHGTPPLPRLLWHYRSKHPSLIAFSNRRFYDDSLLLFPNADASPAAGIGLSLEQVGGLYDRSANLMEAAAVAQAAIGEMLANPGRSLGVVALNIKQTEEILAAFEQLSAGNAQVEQYIDEWKETLSPFFIKNLENVQGDERDTILISTVFGENAQGNFLQNFGVINRDSGPRRLNVLFSRAVYRMRVFTSMHPSWITAPSEGAQVLKAFMEWADGRKLPLLTNTAAKVGPAGAVNVAGRAAFPTGFGPDSPFEEQVMAALKRRGVQVDPQIGEGRYRIDIGARPSAIPGRYILGIECDGAMYHSSKAARDRDRLRQQVLEGLGWRIVRVWSTDWFRDQDAEIGRLMSVLEPLIAAAQAAPPPPPPPPAAPPAAPPAPARPAAPRPAPGAPAPARPAPPGRGPLPPIEDAQTRAVRARLVALQQKIAEQSPEVPPERRLLRPILLDVLLLARPTTSEEFLARVPMSLRQETHGGQMRFLPEILDILEAWEA